MKPITVSRKEWPLNFAGLKKSQDDKKIGGKIWSNIWPITDLKTQRSFWLLCHLRQNYARPVSVLNLLRWVWNDTIHLMRNNFRKLGQSVWNNSSSPLCIRYWYRSFKCLTWTGTPSPSNLSQPNPSWSSNDLCVGWLLIRSLSLSTFLF